MCRHGGGMKFQIEETGQGKAGMLHGSQGRVRTPAKGQEGG